MKKKTAIGVLFDEGWSQPRLETTIDLIDLHAAKEIQSTAASISNLSSGFVQNHSVRFPF